MNFKALTGSIILRRCYYVAPFGLRVLEPRRAAHRLTRFSACRIEDSFVSLTALTQQRRHLIVRLYGLSVLKALQAYTPLTRFRSCGYLAFVRNVTPVTHRLDYPTSLLLCCALWASSSRTPTGCTSAYAFFRLSNRRFVRFVNCVNSTTAAFDCSALRSFSSESPASLYTAYAFYLPAIWLATSSAKLSCLFSRPSPNT